MRISDFRITFSANYLKNSAVTPLQTTLTVRPD